MQRVVVKRRIGLQPALSPSTPLFPTQGTDPGILNEGTATTSNVEILDEPGHPEMGSVRTVRGFHLLVALWVD